MIGTQTKHKQTKKTKTNKQNKQNQQTTKRRCALFPSTLLPLVCLVLVVCLFGWLVGLVSLLDSLFCLFVWFVSPLLALSFFVLCLLSVPLCLLLSLLSNCYLCWAVALFSISYDRTEQAKLTNKQTKQTKQNKQNKQNKQTTKRRFALFPLFSTLIVAIFVC